MIGRDKGSIQVIYFLAIALGFTGIGSALSQISGNEVISLSEDVAGTSMPEEAFTEQRSSVGPLQPLTSDTSVASPLPTARTEGVGGSESNVATLNAANTEAINVDEFEDDFGSVALFDGGFPYSAFDLLSPTNPSGRDNFVIEFGADVGYNSNVLLTSVDQQASGTASANVGVQYLAERPRFQFETRLQAAVTIFENRPGGDRQNTFSAFFDAAYQFRPRLDFNLSFSSSYQAQPDPDVQGGSFAENGSFLVTNLSFNTAYELAPRLSMVGTYTFDSIQYDEESVNQSAGFESNTLSLTANRLLSPKRTILGVLRYNGVSYAEEGQGSDGIILLAGITESVSPRFEWTLRAGAEFRSLRNPDPNIEDAPTEYLGPFVEGELEYSYAPNSTILGTLRYGTEPSGVSGLVIRQSFRLGLSANHQFGRRVSLQTGLNYVSDNFDQPGEAADSTQTITSASAALSYKLNPTLIAVLQGNYLIFESTLPNSNYNQYVLTFGFDITL